MRARTPIALAVAGLIALLAITGALALVGKGDKAPDFSLKTTDNKTVKLADLRGKPVILDFWAPWCPPCRRALPEVQKLYAKYQKQGVVVLGIIEQAETKEAQRVAEQAGVRYALLTDPEGAAARKYAVPGLPTLVAISKQGKITGLEIGYRGPRALEELFKQALK